MLSPNAKISVNVTSLRNLCKEALKRYDDCADVVGLDVLQKDSGVAHFQNQVRLTEVVLSALTGPAEITDASLGVMELASINRVFSFDYKALEDRVTKAQEVKSLSSVAENSETDTTSVESTSEEETEDQNTSEELELDLN